MDFIGNNGDIVLFRKFTNFRQVFGFPNFTNRIMGIAENHQVRLRVRKFLFQISKVNGIFAILIDELILDDIATTVRNAVIEVVVNRRLNDDIFARSGKSLNQRENRRHHTCGKNQIFLLHFQMMPSPPPIDVGVIPSVRNIRIPENTMIQTVFECIQNFGSRPKIHIRHPHGEHILGDIPLYRIRIPPVDYGIEIVFRLQH